MGPNSIYIYTEREILYIERECLLILNNERRIELNEIVFLDPETNKYEYKF